MNTTASTVTLKKKNRNEQNPPLVYRATKNNFSTKD